MTHYNSHYFRDKVTTKICLPPDPPRDKHGLVTLCGQLIHGISIPLCHSVTARVTRPSFCGVVHPALRKAGIWFVRLGLGLGNTYPRNIFIITLMSLSIVQLVEHYCACMPVCTQQLWQMMWQCSMHNKYYWGEPERVQHKWYNYIHMYIHIYI